MAESASGGGVLLLVHHLGPEGADAARAALAAGREVACVSADAAVVAALGRVRVLPPGALAAFEEAAQIPGVFELAEQAVEELLREQPALARALARYGEPRAIDRYLCRWCLRDASALLGLAELAASPELAGHASIEIDAGWPGASELALLARVAERREVGLAAPLASALARLRLPRPGSASAASGLRAGTALWRDWLRRIRSRTSALPRRALLLRTYPTDWAVDVGGSRRLRNVDFVVDDETIRSDEVGIWVEDGVSEERRRALANRGYALLDRSAVTVGALGFAARVVPRLLRAAALLARPVAAEGWWREPIRRLVAESLLWAEIVPRTGAKALLLYNDVHPAGMARTLALRRAGCRVVQYEHACSWAFDEHGWVPDFVNGFLVVDALATWGPLHTETFRAHRGLIGEVWEDGCLWSEHARCVREDPELGAGYRVELQRVYGVSLAEHDGVVGVFDTSSAPLLLSWDDLVAFYAGVAALARRLPRVLFLVKPKGPIETIFANGAGGESVAAALPGASNVVVLDSSFETAAVIAFSDLTVNACYTSPAVETIGAGRPAVYFDPTERFPNAFFRGITRLVTTSEAELVAFVESELAVRTRESVDEFRGRYAALEGYVDGRAISRLRGRLREVLDS